MSVTEKDSLPFLNLRHSLSLSKQSQEQLPLVNVRTENFLGQMQLQQTNKLNNPHRKTSRSRECPRFAFFSSLRHSPFEVSIMWKCKERQAFCGRTDDKEVNLEGYVSQYYLLHRHIKMQIPACQLHLYTRKAHNCFTAVHTVWIISPQTRLKTKNELPNP